jgi:protein-disulfide isomerase
MKAAEATHCAGEQGKYWEMHDNLFANQRELARADLSKHARTLGLDVAAYDQCLDTGKWG